VCVSEWVGRIWGKFGVLVGFAHKSELMLQVIACRWGVKCGGGGVLERIEVIFQNSVLFHAQ
jgi:hypothetical protein